MESSDRQSPLHTAALVMRWALALQCLGAARQGIAYGTKVGTTIFLTLDLSDAVASGVDRLAGWMLCLAAALLIGRKIPHRFLLAGTSFWFLLTAACTWYQGGDFGSHLALIAHATRIAMPIGLWMLLPTLQHQHEGLAIPNTEAAGWVIRIACAITFTAHGIEALMHHPVFVDYIIGTTERWLAWRITQPTAELMLTGIGAVDIGVAVALVSRRWRPIAFYMATWGIITACSRMTYAGMGSFDKTLIRAANGGLPLALYFLWSIPRPQAKNSTVATDERAAA